jgi:TolB-like protein
MSEPVTAFGPFTFDRASMSLTRDGAPVVVGTRGGALLRALLDANGAPVGKDALLEAAWPGIIVEESNLSVQIALLRKALGERTEGGDWVATVPRVGYRLVRVGRAETSSGPDLPTIAVLPFQNLSGDPEQEYFADGMVDDLIAALSRFKSFAVIGRRPSFAHKGSPTDPQDVAAELGVRYLLEGSVRRAGNRLRLVAKLFGGLDGATLWVETFEGLVEDVFDFQDRITRSVAAVVEPQIQRAELERGRRERPASIAAYDLYLRALAQMYVHTPTANAEAFDLIRRALAIEPDNDVFLALASWALEYRTTVGWPRLTADDRSHCVEYAHRALRVAGDNARVLGNCGNAIQSMGGEFELGQLIVNRAVKLNPNDVAL